MTRKTAESYLAIFEFIEERLFKFEPKEFMTDFEEGMRSAIRKRWPNVRIRGCWFHFKRAVNKKCRSLAAKLFRKNRTATIIKDMLTNLPLLPENQILEGYRCIKCFARKKQLSESFKSIFAYFERYWLHQVKTHFTI